ncbi:MAG: hypothetical protein HYV63_34185 [Candidatus Schekmanbacteria bacterium]|nr:hypothetical protein [Candidatus Schekmanbacteria bacterium]
MYRIVVTGLAALACGLALAGTATAGTQDFTLINATGTDIHNLFISESKKDNWEEDVLGEDTLPQGESIKITFSGKKACLWDIMVKDEEGEGVYWNEIDLCETSKVRLLCSESKGCWAEFE